MVEEEENRYLTEEEEEEQTLLMKGVVERVAKLSVAMYAKSKRNCKQKSMEK